MFQFIRTTLVGGFLFLLPIGILVYVIGKVLSVVRTAVEPLSQQLPFESVAGIRAAILLAIVLIVLLSFLAGFIARTQMAQVMTKQLEERLLGRIPAYGLIKSLSADLTGEAARHPVVVVYFDDMRQLGIMMGQTADGAEVVVFLPDAPTPQSGTVVIVDANRVQLTDLPVRKAFVALSSRGLGLAEQI